MIGSKVTLQKDRKPKHTGSDVEKILQSKEEQFALEGMVWPSHSSDPNIIESVLVHKETEELEDLWEVLQNVWNNLLVHYCLEDLRLV